MKMTDACCARTRCDAVLVSGSQHLCSITSSVSRHSVLVYFCRWWHTGNSNLYLNNNIQNFFLMILFSFWETPLMLTNWDEVGLGP